MTKGLEIDTETADCITVLSLKDAFNSMQTDIAEIEELMSQSFGVPEYKKEDYFYNKRTCEAILVVLYYYGATV